MSLQIRLIFAPVRHLPGWKKPFAWLFIAIAGPFYLIAALFLRARQSFRLVRAAKLRKEIYGRR